MFNSREKAAILTELSPDNLQAPKTSDDVAPKVNSTTTFSAFKAKH
jgi:hypothetical protein